MKLVSGTQLLAVTFICNNLHYGNLYTETIGVCSLHFEGVFHFGSHSFDSNTLQWTITCVNAAVY